MRRFACVAAIAAIWAMVFGWAAGLHWNTRLFPHERMVLLAHDFRVAMGAGVEDGDALSVGAIGDDGNALQVHALDKLHAESFPLLRYRFSGFPRTLELSFVFRRADAPEEIHAITVPWPGHGWQVVDLRKIPEWRGDIIELGFAEFATGQLAPPSVAFRPFRFERAELTSLSWRGGLAVLQTAWFDYMPWSLLSVSALAPDHDTVGTFSPVPYWLAGVALSVAAMAWILRWSRRRLLRRAAMAAVMLWLALDLRWLADLHARHALTERVYAGKTWQERERLQPDQDVAIVAEQLRSWLATQPPNRRVLVETDAKYTLLRLLYLLLPENAGILGLAGDAPLAANSLIVLYATQTFVYDAERGVVIGPGTSIPVEPVFEAAGARVFKLRSAVQ